MHQAPLHALSVILTVLITCVLCSPSFSSFAHTASNVQAALQQQLSPLRSGSPRRMYPPARLCAEGGQNTASKYRLASHVRA